MCMKSASKHVIRQICAAICLRILRSRHLFRRRGGCPA
jgi:hypothetical protein